MIAALLIFTYLYFIVGLVVAMSKHGRWRDPWSGEKAFALGVLWLPAFIYIAIKSLVVGTMQLWKEEV